MGGKTLSNFHSPEILAAGAGMLCRHRVDGSWEQHQTEASCPVQQKDYSETFHLIDKGNGKESKFDLGGQTKGHRSWTCGSLTSAWEILIQCMMLCVKSTLLSDESWQWMIASTFLPITLCRLGLRWESVMPNILLHVVTQNNYKYYITH